LAYYLSECVFQGLIQVLSTRGTNLTRGAVEQRMAELTRMTLGPLANAAQAELDPKYHDDLKRAVERRNFLAHGFWFERVHEMTSDEGLKRLITELQADQRLFHPLSQLCDGVVIGRLEAAGLTREMWDEALQASHSMPPKRLVDRPIPKRGSSLAINEAWLTAAGSPILVDSTGQLWQPGADGLEWYLAAVELDWKRPKFSRMLPANVIARPKDATSWNYTLEFSSGFKLVVSRSPDCLISIQLEH
jgi:hypothetical protein